MKIDFSVELSKEELAKAAAAYISEQSGYQVVEANVDVTKLSELICKIQMVLPMPAALEVLKANAADRIRVLSESHSDKLQEQIDEASAKLDEVTA